MPQCKTEGCSVHLGIKTASVQQYGGVCTKCRSGQKKAAYGVALDTPPACRTRTQWEALRDFNAEKIKCLVAQGESVTAVAFLHNQALEALAQMPVQICPHELARLQRRDTQLSLIEYEAKHCIRNPDPGVDVAGRFVHWLQQSGILRGQRF